MNKISGKVVVKGTGIGIPDLLIIIYDLDPECNVDEIFSATPPLSNMEFWGRFKGDRIGSILTSNLGEFELSYEDSEFQVQNPEKRPDLILLVMAPEEPQSKTQRTPTSPQHLILYCSNIPRVNAGRSESYLIRLSTEQLNEQTIPYPDVAQGRLPAKESLISGLERSYQTSDALREKLNERKAQRFAKTKEAAQKAKAAFANFYPSRLSPEVLKDPTYFKPGDDLKVNQRAVIDRDLKQLTETTTKRPLRLYLSREQIDDMGLNIAEDGTVSGTVEFDKIQAYIDRTTLGTELYRIRSLFDARQKEEEVDRIIDQITSSGDDIG